MKSKNVLNQIELDLLGDIKGKDILHLQCHFGQDSLSLAHLGANVTGLDLSSESIAKAKELNAALGMNATFVEGNVYEAKNLIADKFDIVFSTYGTIGWLPDMNKWADIVSHFLKPGGKLILIELHPMLWMFDENFKNIEYSYFNVQPIIESTEGTYANHNAPIQMKEVGWNHDLGEVFSSLLHEGLTVLDFQEYDYSPHNCFKGMVERAPKQYVLETHGSKMPMVYSLVMQK
jgi:SAM-dependent methyltransferase